MPACGHAPNARKTVQTMVRFMRHVMAMPTPWPSWVTGLLLLNLGAVAFVPRVEAWIVLGGLGLGAMLQMGIFARFGFVRLLGLGHFHWFAMVPWLLSRLDTIDDPLLYRWVGAVSVACGMSLVIDTVDVLRYLRGERAPAVALEG
ncbi:MAG: hypothetical protein H0X67_00845 [Acidobacteria bacterium]|nr:hypothetical protein [Acidobacteriota bacterium]